MIAATFAVFVAFAVLALSRPSAGAAFGVVVASMLLWPEYLRIPMGLASMSVPRLVALAVLARFYVQGRPRLIRFGAIDRLVLLIWLWTILATVFAGGEFALVSEMIGRGFDTVLMYFLARFALCSEQDARAFCFWLVITAVAMCAAGLYEALTGQSPYRALRGYRAWAPVSNKGDEYRYGLLRASASTSVSIYFGMAMMLILGLLRALRGYSQLGRLHWLAVLAAGLAALSSMSSGPWIAVFMLLGLYVYEHRPQWIKPSIYCICALMVAMEVASNRHFYHLIDYLAIDKQTAWYRTRLLEVAVSRWYEFWLFGVGSNWPGHWADLIDGRGHIDVVNHFLILALHGGLLALAMYVASHVLAIKSCVRSWHESTNPERRRLMFGLVVTLIALDFSSMSVGLFGPPLLLSHMLLGVMVSAATAWKPAGESASKPVVSAEPALGHAVIEARND